MLIIRVRDYLCKVMYLINVFVACLFLQVTWGTSDCNVCTCLFNMVTCDSSSVTEIPLSWPGYTTLFVNQVIYINTGVTTLRNNTFLNFPHLQEITITNSQLNEIEEGAFNGIASELTKIDFTNSKLNMINPRWFTNMTSLQQLILSNNSIEFILANSFTDLIKLETLKLDNNQIKRINGDNVQSLNTAILTEIALGQNRLVCDCYLEWLQKLVIAKPSKFLQPVVCTLPSNTTGYEISKVSDLSTYCLSLCLEVSCTENSHCVVEDEFPTCDCNQGYIPIGEGTYECSAVLVPSSTVLTTSTSLPHTSTSSSSSSLMSLSPSVLTTTTTTTTVLTTTMMPSTSIPKTTSTSPPMVVTTYSTILPIPVSTSTTHSKHVDLIISISITLIFSVLTLVISIVVILVVVWKLKSRKQIKVSLQVIQTLKEGDTYNPIYLSK